MQLTTPPPDKSSIITRTNPPDKSIVAPPPKDNVWNSPNGVSIYKSWITTTVFSLSFIKTLQLFTECALTITNITCYKCQIIYMCVISHANINIKFFGMNTYLVFNSKVSTQTLKPTSFSLKKIFLVCHYLQLPYFTYQFNYISLRLRVNSHVTQTSRNVIVKSDVT